MVVIKFKGQEYVCEDENKLVEELKNERIIPNLIQESVDPDIIRVTIENTIWMINGYIFGKIMDRVPDLIKKKGG